MTGYTPSLQDIFDEFSRDYYDPRDPFARQQYEEEKRKVNFSFGIVTDNQDPDKKGRIKVLLPMVAKNYITDWIMGIHPFKGDGYGVWNLPDIKDQVFVFFRNGDIHRPFYFKSMYTPRHRPPLSENPDNNLKVVKTKKTYLLMDDTPGEERIEASIKDGKIRVVVDTKGIHLTNELGGVNFKCRKMTLSGKASRWVTEKDVKINAGGNISIKTNKETALTASGDVTIKGSTVDLKGSTGVTAEMKQIAKENDPVAGMDLHDIMVPSNSGLAKVPAIPHPYIGKLNDKLSSDVNVMNKPAAVKGSMSEFTTPGHFPMPPGVKFAANPDNKGEVTNGCVDSVKINGEPAAVLGSTVTTCDDAGMQDQCAILAVGTTVTFPIQYPGQDPEQYRRDGGLPVNVSNPAVYTPEQAAYADEPKSLTNLQWSESRVDKGTEVILSCTTSGVREEAGVMFSIYPDGADPETDPPVMDIRGHNKGGRAEVKWCARDIRKPESGHGMKWFFTAWTLYCPKATSGQIEVTRLWPEFNELKWKLVTRDEEVSEIEYGLTASLSARVENLEDGDNVRCLVYEEGYEDPQLPLTRKLLEVKDAMVTMEWPVKVSRERLDELTEDDELKFVFALEDLESGVRSGDSPAVRAGFVYRVDYLIESEKIKQSEDYTLKNSNDSYGKTLNSVNDSKPGENRVTLVFDELLPGGSYSLIIAEEDEDRVIFENRLFGQLFTEE